MTRLRFFIMLIVSSMLSGCASTPASMIDHEDVHARPSLAPLSVVTHVQKDPYDELIESWASHGAAEALRVGIGNFHYGDSEASIPLSSRLADELETRISRHPNFRAIARRNLRDLEQERRFQGHSLFDPNVMIPDFKVEAIDVIIRGRIYPRQEVVDVFVEMLLLENGELKKAKLTLPARETGSLVRYDKALSEVDAIKHDVTEKLPREFDLSIVTASPRPTYRTGAKVAFVVRSDIDCHIAVLAHQSDGSTIVLFPNAYQRNTWVPGDEDVLIPGVNKDGFEIVVGPPYGIDVVQVIACTTDNALHDEIHRMQQESGRVFAATTRGLMVQSLSKGLQQSKSHPQPVRWSSDYVLVTTHE